MQLNIFASVFLIFLIILPSYDAHSWVGKWGAWSLHKNEKDLCFIAATPHLKSPKNILHGRIYFLLTLWDRQDFQLSVVMYYDIDETFQSFLIIDQHYKFNFFASKRRLFMESFLYTEKSDLISLFKKGLKFSVHVRSLKGVSARYDFDLTGFFSAYSALLKECAHG